MLKKNRFANDILLLVLAVVIFTGVFMYWGNLKSVNFCDEVYTYILSNSDNEFLACQLEAGKWYEDGAINHILSAENGFQFGQVMLNNKGDVHPPIYYFVIHILSVLNAGSSSKWIGLAANWIFAVLSMIILYVMLKQITGKKSLGFVACLVYISSPAVLSTNMFLRMYGMFSMWVLLFAWITYLIYINKEADKKKKIWLYVALGAITFCGFLTQYYFAVFCVIFTFFYCLYKLFKKKWKEIFAYGGSLCAAVVVATVFWKTWVRHMFSGYLGGSVVENALNFGKFFESIRFGCTHLFTLMYGKLGLVVALIVIAAMVYMFIKKDKRVNYVFILIATAVAYSICVYHLTPTHLLSYRYFFPVVVIAYLGEILAVYCVAENVFKEKNIGIFGRKKLELSSLAVVLCLVLTVLNFIRPVYDRDAVTYVDSKGTYAKQMALLEENKSIPWLYFGYENAMMTELMYDSLISEKFMMVNYDAPFTDEEYTKKDCEFMLFAEAATYYVEDSFTYLDEWFEGELEYELLTEKGFMSVYKVTHRIK